MEQIQLSTIIIALILPVLSTKVIDLVMTEGIYDKKYKWRKMVRLLLGFSIPFLLTYLYLITTEMFLTIPF
jgi:hypothetical protein